LSKEEDKFLKLEQAIGLQEENLREVLKFFSICQNEEYKRSFRKSTRQENNLFIEFYKLSFFLVGLVEKNNLFEEIN